MRKIREVLRLKFDTGLSVRKIARSLGIGHSSAGDYLCRFAASGLAWPIDLSDAELNRHLFPPTSPVPSEQRPLPDWPRVHAELRRPGVTLALLWQEYRLSHPQGFQYSWYCEHYRLWAAKVDVVMRQEHRAGEKLFVDYAGQTVPVIDRHTGEIRQAQVFVAVLGASSYTFAEATWSQQLPDWLGSHVRCFIFLGGVSEILVPDNLRSGVTKAHRYEPDINPIWLATEPMDMRAGTETALARVIAVFGAAKPHCAYLFANRRANRMKVLVHDGIGVWLAARRLNQGKFHWPGIRHGGEMELDTEQLRALVLGLPWQRVGAGGAITLL